LGQLQKIESELMSLGFQIVAISGETPDQLKSGAKKNQLNYRLLSDSSMSAAAAFGIAYRVGDEVVTRYKEYGIELPRVGGFAQLPVPAVFLVRKDGTVAFSYANPDYRVRLHPDVLLAAARSETLHPQSPGR
jgi:peroxiredoxin